MGQQPDDSQQRHYNFEPYDGHPINRLVTKQENKTTQQSSTLVAWINLRLAGG